MIYGQLKRIGMLVLVGVALSVVYTVVGPHAKAAALHGSVIISTGDWDSNGSQTGMAIPTSVNTSSEFKTFIYGLLHNTSESGDPGSDYNKYGAAFLVENMIHGKNNYSANSTLVNAANADYSKWAGYIDDYSSAGRIQWAVSRTVAAGNFNSTHVCVEGSGGYCWDRATYYNNNYNNGGYDDHQFQFYTMKSSESATLMIFTNPNGTTFQIRRECGNVIGSAGPLQELGWNLNGRTVASPTTVYAGETTSFASSLQNTGASTASTTWTVAWCTDACSSWNNHASGTDSAVAKGGTWELENTYPWTVSTSATYTKLCVRISYTNASGPGTASETATPACVTVIPLQSTCGGVTVNPALVGTTDDYTITASVNTNGGQPGAQNIADNSNFFITVSGPSVNVNNQNVTPVTVSGTPTDTGAGKLTTSLSPGATGDSGAYSISYGITGSTAPVTCSGSFTVAYRPYFSVQGGDIAAGPGFGGSCTEANAGVNSWNTGTPDYSGAGGELGVWATGNITNFVSGMGLSGGAPGGGGYGLSFSNTNGIGGSGYGGSFGPSAVPCMLDYYGAKPAGTTTTSSSTLVDLSLPSGSYTAKVDGFNTFTVGGSGDIYLGNGRQLSIYVKGNLYIKNNIKYTYATLADIPQVRFIVQGDIYIDPAVTELHGIFIAQKSAANPSGRITTCSPGVTSLPQAYGSCKSQLTIVGAVAAEGGIRMNRTYGNMVATPSAPGLPAEVFQYSPEMWLAEPPNNSFNYQAYSDLPPVL